MIRPAELEAIRRGEIDLAFRRWERPQVKAGTRMRTSVGLLEVLAVDRVAVSGLRAEDARRCGAPSVAALKEALSTRSDRPVFRVHLQYAGPDPRAVLRETIPEPDELVSIVAGLDRLDAASPVGPWTRTTLRLIDANPEVRAPELAERVDRPTQEFKGDVRKLKERGLTESLAIGYLISARGEAVLDHIDGPRERTPRRSGTPLPRSIGAPATRALRDAGLHTLESVSTWSRSDVAALHGVGPIALERLAAAMTELGLRYTD